MNKEWLVVAASKEEGQLLPPVWPSQLSGNGATTAYSTKLQIYRSVNDSKNRWAVDEIISLSGLSVSVSSLELHENRLFIKATVGEWRLTEWNGQPTSVFNLRHRLLVYEFSEGNWTESLRLDGNLNFDSREGSSFNRFLTDGDTILLEGGSVEFPINRSAYRWVATGKWVSTDADSVALVPIERPPLPESGFNVYRNNHERWDGFGDWIFTHKGGASGLVEIWMWRDAAGVKIQRPFFVDVPNERETLALRVSLESVPVGAVEITLRTSERELLSVEPDRLVFQPSNFSRSQDIVLTPQKLSDTAPNQAVEIRIDVTASEDRLYDRLVVSPEVFRIVNFLSGNRSESWTESTTYPVSGLGEDTGSLELKNGIVFAAGDLENRGKVAMSRDDHETHYIQSLDGVFGDQFGASLSVTEDYLWIGSPRDDASGMDRGIVWAYERAEAAPDWGPSNRLVPPKTSGRAFGQFVIFDRSFGVVAGEESGAPNSWRLYLYALDFRDKWVEVGRSDTIEWVSDIAFSSGLLAVSRRSPILSHSLNDVLLFELNREADGYSLTQIKELRGSSDLAGPGYGEELELQGNVLAVSDPVENRVFIYDRHKSGWNSWTLVAVLDNGRVGDRELGSHTLAMDRGLLAVLNAPVGDVNVYGQNIDGTDSWGLLDAFSTGFGAHSVAIEKDRVAVLKRATGGNNARVVLFEPRELVSDAEEQPHPADTNKDFRIGIAEVTAYGAAWKKGEDWAAGPQPIPIDYLTRAGAIWKNGEVYIQDKSRGDAPLWWVNTDGHSQ